MAKSRNTNSATGAPTSEQARERAVAADPERISQRAYELYLQRGGSDGRDWDDWLEAERQLRNPRQGDSDE